MLGVSPDDEASHAKFKEKYELPFTLLADADHAVADDYGVWVEKKNYGKTYMGVERSTFVIDEPTGNVAKVLRRVKPDDARRRRPRRPFSLTRPRGYTVAPARMWRNW